MLCWQLYYWSCLVGNVGTVAENKGRVKTEWDIVGASARLTEAAEIDPSMLLEHEFYDLLGTARGELLPYGS